MIVNYTDPDSPNPMRIEDVQYFAVHGDRLYMLSEKYTHLAIREFNNVDINAQDGYTLIYDDEGYYEQKVK